MIATVAADRDDDQFGDRDGRYGRDDDYDGDRDRDDHHADRDDRYEAGNNRGNYDRSPSDRESLTGSLNPSAVSGWKAISSNRPRNSVRQPGIGCTGQTTDEAVCDGIE